MLLCTSRSEGHKTLAVHHAWGLPAPLIRALTDVNSDVEIREKMHWHTHVESPWYVPVNIARRCLPSNDRTANLTSISTTHAQPHAPRIGPLVPACRESYRRPVQNALSSFHVPSPRWSSPTATLAPSVVTDDRHLAQPSRRHPPTKQMKM
ncbi:hypothetical protein L210DRAFT_2263888 [Boletus edulis BED1]|uniref:Uncharacterized protein n=1 Tax=Boletus edulis BED1 TaxID=1328754 RepID=A0AAD4BSP1_BOLED|nr:hypothetical protein L210DRAFT_2263888 [Boletus edulis BED1]